MTDTDPREFILFYENLATVDGRMITNARWDERVPLVTAERFEQHHVTFTTVGAVYNIHREVTTEGLVVLGTATCSLVQYVGLAAECDFNDITIEGNEELLRLVDPRLWRVVLGENPCWEGMVITA